MRRRRLEIIGGCEVTNKLSGASPAGSNVRHFIIMTSIPSKKDLNVYDSLDEKSAVENFFGKDLIEAENLFKENFQKYQEDLMWMGCRGFEYYVIAAINYLKSTIVENNDEGDLEAFCKLINYRIESEDKFKESAKRVLEEPIKDFLNLKISEKMKSRLNTILSIFNV